MGQRADEVRRPDSRGEHSRDVYVARPGESHVVRTEGTHEIRPVDTDATAAHAHAEPATESRSENEIRAEMVRTRAEMSHTIDAIQERLSPQELKEQAKEVAKEVTEQVTAQMRHAVRDATEQAKHAVRRATIGRAEELVEDARDTARGASANMMDMIRANPVPAAMVGLGLAWMFMKGGDRGVGTRGYLRDRREWTTDAAYRGTEATYPYGVRHRDYYERDYDRDRGPIGQATDRVGETASRVQDQAGRMASEAGERAQEAASSAREMAGDMIEGAGEVVGSAGYAARYAGTNFMDTIRANPLPAALAGIGLGWLFMNSAGRSPDRYPGYLRHQAAEGDYDRATRYDYGRRGEDGQDAVGEMASRVGETAGAVQERAGRLASGAQRQVGQFGSQAQYRMHGAQGQLGRMMQDNPLALGVVTAAVGAAVGLALPETRRERELMGEARDRVMEQAQGVVQETTEKVQRVADEVQSTAQREAEKQGLTPQSGTTQEPGAHTSGATQHATTGQTTGATQPAGVPVVPDSTLESSATQPSGTTHPRP